MNTDEPYSLSVQKRRVFGVTMKLNLYMLVQGLLGLISFTMFKRCLTTGPSQELARERAILRTMNIDDKDKSEESRQRARVLKMDDEEKSDEFLRMMYGDDYEKILETQEG